MKKLFLLLVFFCIVLSSFSRSNSKGSIPPPLPAVIVKSRTLVLDFYTVNKNLKPPVYGYQQRPYFNNYLNRDSELTLNLYNSDLNSYYCEVFVEASSGYSPKKYIWKKGSSINIDVPTNRSYTITVNYYEPWACPMYTYSGSSRGNASRIYYSYKKSFTLDQALYNVDISNYYFKY